MWCKPNIAIGFSKDRLLIRIKRRGHEDMLHSCAPDRLIDFVQSEHLRGLACTVSLPVTHCRVKTVMLARVSAGELRNMTRQDYFWQESLGVATDEFDLRWRLLPSRESDQISVLLSALPKRRRMAYLAPIVRAKLHVVRQSLVCFDWLSATQTGACHCAVVLDSEVYLIAVGSFGICFQRLDHIGMRDVWDESSLSRLLSELAVSIRQLFADRQKAATENQPVTVSVVSPEARAFNRQVIENLPTLLPAQFSVRLIATREVMQRDISVAAGATDISHKNQSLSLVAAGIVMASQKRHKQYPDFSDTSASQRTRFVRHCVLSVFFCSLLLFAVSGYTHWNLLRERNILQLKFAHYADLSEQHAQHLQMITSLRQEQQRYAAFVADIRSLRVARAVYPRLLEIIAVAAMPDLSVHETEFYAPSVFRIQGNALSNRTVVRYVDTLRRYEIIPHVVIKSLVTEAESRMKRFTIDCQVAEFAESIEI